MLQPRNKTVADTKSKMLKIDKSKKIIWIKKTTIHADGKAHKKKNWNSVQKIENFLAPKKVAGKLSPLYT